MASFEKILRLISYENSSWAVPCLALEGLSNPKNFSIKKFIWFYASCMLVVHAWFVPLGDWQPRWELCHLKIDKGEQSRWSGSSKDEETPLPTRLDLVDELCKIFMYFHIHSGLFTGIVPAVVYLFGGFYCVNRSCVVCVMVYLLWMVWQLN